jgi:hypothetical protein
MKQNYKISVDHHSTYGIRRRGKYGLTIMRAGVGTANVVELASEKELRDALSSLDYTPKEIADILEMLAEKKSFWTAARDFDESAVAALGF